MSVCGLFTEKVQAVDESVGSHLDVQVHLFERSIQLMDKKNKPFPPLQIIFALKVCTLGLRTERIVFVCRSTMRENWTATDGFSMRLWRS